MGSGLVFSSFRSGLENPDLKSQPSPREGRANLHSSKKANAHPREGRANHNPNGLPQHEEPTPTLRRANLCLREGRANPKPEEGRANSQTQWPTPTQRANPCLFSPTLGDNYHCVKDVKILNKKPQNWSHPRPQERRVNPNFKPEKANGHPVKELQRLPKRRKGQAPSQKGWGHVFHNYKCDLSHPSFWGRVQPHPSFTLGQAWPSLSGSGLAPPLPFLLAGPLAFPFSPFLAGPGFPLFWVGPWPTLTREGPTTTQEWEGPTQPQRGRVNLHAEKKSPNSQPDKQKNKIISRT